MFGKIDDTGKHLISMEEWRDCIGFRNKYQVSNLGNVRSLNYNKTGRIQLLSQTLSSGYLKVTMDNQTNFIHRIVAKYFLLNPDNFPEIDHINRIKTDNRVENLRWVTKSLQAINRKARQTKSGYNNISITAENYFRIDVRRQGLYCRKVFKTIEEAIQARDKLILPE